VFTCLNERTRTPIEAVVIGWASGSRTNDDRAERDHPCPRWRHHWPALGRLDGVQQVAVLV